MNPPAKKTKPGPPTGNQNARKPEGTSRVHININVAPETARLLATKRIPGESLGRTIDRLLLKNSVD